MLLLGLSQLAWRCHAQTTTLAFTTSIPPNTYSATCGWYTFTYQTWCPSATAAYVVPRSSCSLVPGGAPPTSCPPSPAYASVSCANAATCLQTVSAPNSVNLCVVVVNTGTAAITCDVSITGEGLAPDLDQGVVDTTTSSSLGTGGSPVRCWLLLELLAKINTGQHAALPQSFHQAPSPAETDAPRLRPCSRACMQVRRRLTPGMAAAVWLGLSGRSSW